MPREVEFEGTVHQFPDDATDTEIQQALGGDQPSLGSRLMRAGAETAEDIGIGALKGLGHTTAGVSELLGKIPVVGETLAPAAGIESMKQMTEPEGTAQKLGYYGEQIGEYMLPTGLEEKATAGIGKTLMRAPSIIRGAAKMLPAAISAGTVSGLQGTGFLPGAAVGAVGAPIGSMLHQLGGDVAARAAGVMEKQLKYGARPGEEILGLKGITPSTIRSSAANEALALTRELEGEVGRTKGIINLTSVKDIVNNAVDKAAEGNDLTTFNHLQPLADQVLSLPDKATPREALNYKRGLKPLTKFYKLNPVTDEAQAAARMAYDAADDVLDKAVPRANELDDRIHSLLTVAGPKGTGSMGFGKYMLPWLAARGIEAAGGGPWGELLGMGLTFAGESPTGRLLLARGLGKAPALMRMGRYPTIQAAQALK